MGDPFSVAGSAVGVVSLGLQVCQGLASYIDKYKSADKEVKSCKCKVEGLNLILQELYDLLKGADGTDPPLSGKFKVALRMITDCESGIQDVKITLSKIQTDSSEPSQGVFPKIKTASKRALYPFRRDALVGLLTVLEWLQENLDTALALLQMNLPEPATLRSICDAQQEVDRDFDAFVTSLQSTKHRQMRELSSSSSLPTNVDCYGRTVADKLLYELSMDTLIQGRVTNEIQISGYLIEIFFSIMEGGVSQTHGILRGEHYINYANGCIGDAFRFNLTQKMMESTNNWKLISLLEEDPALLAAFEIIRFFTFEALQIPHTCRHPVQCLSTEDGDCDYSPHLEPCYHWEPKDWEEIDEMQDEWRELISVHGDLVARFQIMYETSDLLLCEFLDTIWREEMLKRSENDDPLSQEEISRVRELGVILHEVDDDLSGDELGEEELKSDAQSS
ncbi:hypothetical protein PoHVEF18_003428 [Penicillium ochrochloron]